MSVVWHAQGSTRAAFGGRPPPAAAGGLALGSTFGRQRPCNRGEKFRRCLGSNPCLPTSAARSRVRSVLDTQAMAGAREAGCVEPRSGPAAAFPLDPCVAASPSRGCKVSAAPRQQSVCAHAARCRVRCVLDTQPMAWQLPQIGGCVEPRRGLAWPSRAEQLPPLAASATVGQGQDAICVDSMQMHSFRRSCRWYACGVRDPAAPPGVGAIAGVAGGLHVPKASGSLVQCWHSRPAAGPQVGEHTLLPSSCYGQEVVPQAPGCPREHVVHGQTCTAAAGRSPGHPVMSLPSRRLSPFAARGSYLCTCMSRRGASRCADCRSACRLIVFRGTCATGSSRPACVKCAERNTLPMCTFASQSLCQDRASQPRRSGSGPCSLIGKKGS